MTESIEAFFTINLTELSQYVIDPNKRIFGLYLLSACVLALLVYLRLTRFPANNKMRADRCRDSSDFSSPKQFTPPDQHNRIISC